MHTVAAATFRNTAGMESACIAAEADDHDSRGNYY
jgi:hypothetical protein